ncbi:MAG: glycosyltransferase family 4 protein [Candidatus Omnitrophica bacterium]|nr:glycosyltransferase family 4 protein [Candidatus Omnitrophota bacterium]
MSRIDREKFRPFLICPEEGDLLSQAADLKIETEVIPVPSIRLWTISTTIRTLSRLLTYIAEKDIKVIHTDDARQVLYLGILRLFRKFKIVWHVRVSWRNVIVDGICYRLSDRIICTAGKILKKFIGMKDFKKKAKLIYNAVDCDYFRPRAVSDGLKDKYGISGEGPVIGFIARLQDVKGLHFLIKALPAIKQEYPNIKLIVIGDGEENYKRKIQTMIDGLNLREDVIFTGFQRDIRPYACMLDISVLPTKEFEGSSRSILESMACGIAVLATDIGGNSELIDNGVTGLLIPEPDPRLIADMTISLLRDKDRLADMGSRAREKALSKFEISKNVRLTEEIYEELVN